MIFRGITAGFDPITITFGPTSYRAQTTTTVGVETAQWSACRPRTPTGITKGYGFDLESTMTISMIAASWIEWGTATPARAGECSPVGPVANRTVRARLLRRCYTPWGAAPGLD